MNISPVNFSGLKIVETNNKCRNCCSERELPFADELIKNPDKYDSYDKAHALPFSKHEFCKITNKKVGDTWMITDGNTEKPRWSRTYTIV